MKLKTAIGVDMGGTRIKIGLVRENELVAHANVEANAHLSIEERLAGLRMEIDGLLQEHGYDAGCIGIAFPGIVDSVRNKVLSKYVKYPGAQNFDFVAWARKEWNIPLALENDARAALVAEWQYGAGRDCGDLVLITLGTGVGSAVMINGSLLRGKHFMAGNLGGHFTINLYGDLCNCGNIGCLESEGSTWALEKHVTQAPEFSSSALSAEEEINFHAVFRLAQQGDKLAVTIRDRCLKAWSLGIISLIHAYDPQRIVIGGGIMKSKDAIIPYVKEMIQKHSWSSENHLEVVAAEQVEYAGILGMCYLATLQQEMNKPVL